MLILLDLSSALSALLSIAFLFALVGLPILALVSLVHFGGVWRNALAHFSIGLLLLVASSPILAAWAASDARHGDSIIGVVVTVCPFPWVGSALLLWGLEGFGINRWLIAALWMVNLAALLFLEFFYLGPAPYGGAPFILYAAVTSSVAVLLLLLRQRWGALLKGLLLGLGSAAIVLVVYGFGRQEILLTPNSSDPPERSLGASFWLTLFLGVVLFFVARFWSLPFAKLGRAKRGNDDQRDGDGGAQP